MSLVVAETYAFFILFLGYFQTIWPLRRAPVSLPEAEQECRTSISDSHYNEPLDVVRYTTLGALNMDWPPTSSTSIFSTTAGAKNLSSLRSRPAAAIRSAPTTSMQRRATSIRR